MFRSWQFLRALLALVLAAGVACPPASALVALNDGHDHIFVTGGLTVSHDSNVFAQNGGKGDFLYTTNFAADYQRHAGWIGVNAGVSIAGGHYGSIKNQDFSDPNFSLEFTKQSGRTTGSITIGAARETRADAAVNTRDSSWNYVYGANYHYHISGTLDLSGGLGYSSRKYTDDVAFVNLATYTANWDLIKLISSERDMMFGYRYRYSDTARNTSSTDHNFSLGIHGKVIHGINGSLRFGYQFREPHGHTLAGTTDSRYQSWSAGGTVSYAINKRMNLGASISKDFSTTATDASVDALVTSLDLQFAFNSRFSLTANGGFGENHFLGGIGPSRHDTYLTWGAGANYSFTEHLKLSFSYLWFENYSTLSFADFVRSSFSFGASSRW